MKRRTFVKGLLAVLAVPSIAFSKIKEKFIPKSELRRVEKLVEKNYYPLDGVYYEWEQCRIKDIKKGEDFRMFEPDGLQVKDEYGHYAWRAAKDAYLKEDGLWHVDVVNYWYHGQGMDYPGKNYDMQIRTQLEIPEVNLTITKVPVKIHPHKAIAKVKS